MNLQLDGKRTVVVGSTPSGSLARRLRAQRSPEPCSVSSCRSASSSIVVAALWRGPAPSRSTALAG
jgi:hypothetical protein